MSVTLDRQAYESLFSRACQYDNLQEFLIDHVSNGEQIMTDFEKWVDIGQPSILTSNETFTKE